MTDLDRLYAHFLRYGFIVLGNAVDSMDSGWIQLELDLLHNVPSLIGESNLERHRYFWLQERTLYVARMLASGNEEGRSRMLTFYQPIWDVMEPILTQLGIVTADGAGTEKVSGTVDGEIEGGHGGR